MTTTVSAAEPPDAMDRIEGGGAGLAGCQVKVADAVAGPVRRARRAGADLLRVSMKHADATEMYVVRTARVS